MKLRLIDNWTDVFKQAWSVKFGMAGGLFGLIGFLMDVGVYLPYLQDYLPRSLFFWLTVSCAVAGFTSRFIKQDTLSGASDGADTPAA